MEERKAKFREERIKYLKNLIGKLQLSDNVDPLVYQTATEQLRSLYEVANV